MVSVEGTAREAVDQGYSVIVVGGCCASASQGVHDSALSNSPAIPGHHHHL